MHTSKLLVTTILLITGHLCVRGQYEMTYASLAVKYVDDIKDNTIIIDEQSRSTIKAGELMGLLAELKNLESVKILVTDPTIADPAPRMLSSAEQAIAIEKLKQMLEKTDVRKGAEPIGGYSETTASPMPSTKQTALLSAIADVLVDRMKEELALAYFDKMAVKMDSVFLLSQKCADGQVTGICSLSELMPSTHLIFKESRTHISPQIGATFKAACMEDLEQLPLHLSEAFEKGFMTWTDANECQGDPTLPHLIGLLGSRLFIGISEGKRWDEVLAHLSTTNGVDPLWIKHGAAIDLVLRLLQSVEKPNGAGFEQYSPAWMGAQMAYYSGFLAQNKILNKDLADLGFTGSMASIASAAVLIANELGLAAKAGSRLDALLNSAPNGAQEKAQYVLNVSAAFKAMIVHGDNAMGQLFVKLSLDEAKPYHIDPKVYETFDLAMVMTAEVAREDYGRIALYALKLLHTFLPSEVVLDEDLVKLITLAADISEAERGQVKDIFEAAILPVGSYRIKQSTSFSVSLNAYTGLSGGAEILGETNGAKVFGGIHAPIGFGLNWSKGTEQHLKASNSLFLSVIDLGTLVSYRFGTEDSVNATPEVTFANVLAPGLYFVHGFRECPISIGVGGQFAPKLRSIEDGVAKVIMSDAFRYGAFVAVDIPFFHLSLKRTRLISYRNRINELEMKKSALHPKDPQLDKKTSRIDRKQSELREDMKKVLH